MIFSINGVNWSMVYVDPTADVLIDRTGRRTVGCTDPIVKQVYISNELRGERLRTVIIHEICHCILVSYGLTNYIHLMVYPEYWFEAEEFLCNFLTDYGGIIFETLNILK